MKFCKEDCFYYEELLEEYANLQCVYCGGWALTCPCKSNIFTEEEKKEIEEYLKWRDK